VSGVTTHSRRPFAFLDLIEVGNHSIPHGLTVIEDVPALKAADRHLRGILGQNFLARFDLLIDNSQRILCLDESGSLALGVKVEHIPLEQPHGPRDDMPFTRPIIVSVRLTAADVAPLLLRLDSGSNATLLYASHLRLLMSSVSRTPMLKRGVDGVSQAFTVLPRQDILVGASAVRQVSFVMPLNGVGSGPLPAKMAFFQRALLNVSSLATRKTMQRWTRGDR
jgi:hypothetical protein